eukprot:729325-Prymnesium_polylepis.1
MASSSASERFGAAAIGAGVAELMTLPVDAAKVRLQMQAGSERRYTGLMQGMYRIASEEGVATLWRGFEPALVRQISYTGMTFVLYEPVRNIIAGNVPKDEIPFFKRVLAGGTAGGLSIFVMNPTDVVKTQMQAASRVASPPRMSLIARCVRTKNAPLRPHRLVRPASLLLDRATRREPPPPRVRARASLAATS